MNSFKNNKVVLSVFAILMAIGLMAAYIPLLFPPSESRNVPSDGSVPTDNYAARLPQNSVPTATSTVSSTPPVKASLPDSFSGLQDEQKSLDDINNLLK